MISIYAAPASRRPRVWIPYVLTSTLEDWMIYLNVLNTLCSYTSYVMWIYYISWIFQNIPAKTKALKAEYSSKIKINVSVSSVCLLLKCQQPLTFGVLWFVDGTLLVTSVQERNGPGHLFLWIFLVSVQVSRVVLERGHRSLGLGPQLV